MSGPEGRLDVAPGPECCCKLKYAICRERFCVALPLTATAGPAVLGPLFLRQLLDPFSPFSNFSFLPFRFPFQFQRIIG